MRLDGMGAEPVLEPPYFGQQFLLGNAVGMRPVEIFQDRRFLLGEDDLPCLVSRFQQLIRRNEAQPTNREARGIRSLVLSKL